MAGGNTAAVARGVTMKYFTIDWWSGDKQTDPDPVPTLRETLLEKLTRAA